MKNGIIVWSIVPWHRLSSSDLRRAQPFKVVSLFPEAFAYSILLAANKYLTTFLDTSTSYRLHASMGQKLAMAAQLYFLGSDVCRS
jgi:hypothetical protein